MGHYAHFVSVGGKKRARTERASEARNNLVRRLTGVGRRGVRKIWHSRVQTPIYKEAYDDDETYEKRKPCRGVFPNRLRITSFCPLRSVQLLACYHSQFPPSRTKRSGLRRA